MSSARPIFGLALSLALAAAASSAASAQAPYAGRDAVAPQNRPSVAAPLRTVAISYAQLPSTDPTFKALWTLDPRRIDIKGYPPTAYVGYVREASGSLLTITMLSAPEECGPSRCSMKIVRDGKVLKEFVGCNEPTGHRITADGKYLMVCDTAVPIPPS